VAERPSLLQTIANRIDRFSDLCGRAVSWLVLALVILTFLVAVSRYVLNLDWPFLNDLRSSLATAYNRNVNALSDSVQYLHAIIFMVGIAYALKLGDHVRIDIFYRRFSGRTKAWVDALGTLLLLYPTFVFIIWMSWGYVLDSWHVLEGSQKPGGLPLIYLLKSFILLMSVMVIIQGTALLLRALLCLRNTAEPGEAS
jgi:TRAP-type mannitol/chloroaromatic compound transport system permease small subunit